MSFKLIYKNDFSILIIGWKETNQGDMLGGEEKKNHFISKGLFHQLLCFHQRRTDASYSIS